MGEQLPEDLTDVGQKRSTLEAYFMLNKDDEYAHNFTYQQIPEHYRWEGKQSIWIKRRNRWKVIGRMHNMTLVSNPELYHLRFLQGVRYEPDHFLKF
jgi:hypothetical protein